MTSQHADLDHSMDVYTHQEIKPSIHGQKYDMELVAKVSPSKGEALC